MSETTESIRDSINAAFAESETPAETPATAPSQPRDEHGRFASKAGDAEPVAAEEIEPATEETVAPAEEPVAEEKPAEPEKPALEAPQNWDVKARETFKTLPPDAQQFMLDRYKGMEADYTRKTQQIAELRREYGPIDEMFRPYQQQMRERGFTPSTLIQGWMAMEKALLDGKGVDLIDNVVKAYNIDRGALARKLGLAAAVPTGQGEQPPEPAGQPAIPEQIADKLYQLERWQAMQDQQRVQQQIAAQRAEETRVMTAIEQFSSAVGPDGKPLRPYFADVEDAMTALAIAERTRTGTVPDLQTLYDQAVWANPATREKLIAAQTAAVEAKRAADEKAKREAARAKAVQAQRAASSVVGAPGTGQANPRRGDAMSLREQLAEAFEEAGAS